MNNQPTPGSFHVETRNCDKYPFAVYGLNAAGPVAFIPQGTRAAANAKLIAAAPELLAALETLVAHVLHYEAMPHAHPIAARDAANARAAIAKATA